MANRTFVLKFENTSVANANRYAEDLRRTLLDADPQIEVNRQRDDESAQDFGATLVLVLGTPAVIALAKALHDWSTRNNAVSITIEDNNRRLIAKNLESKAVPAIVEAFRDQQG